MSTIEVKVPDIGDFKDVPVIELLVKPGDSVKAEDSLVTLESDKATMDVPSPSAGRIKDLKVKVGDKVSEGSVILTLETEGAPPPIPYREILLTARIMDEIFGQIRKTIGQDGDPSPAAEGVKAQLT